MNYSLYEYVYSQIFFRKIIPKLYFRRSFFTLDEIELEVFAAEARPLQTWVCIVLEFSSYFDSLSYWYEIYAYNVRINYLYHYDKMIMTKYFRYMMFTL